MVNVFSFMVNIVFVCFDFYIDSNAFHFAKYVPNGKKEQYCLKNDKYITK